MATAKNSITTATLSETEGGGGRRVGGGVGGRSIDSGGSGNVMRIVADAGTERRELEGGWRRGWTGRGVGWGVEARRRGGGVTGGLGVEEAVIGSS